MPIDLLEFKKLSEGALIKRADSPYGSPQNEAWAKYKLEYEIDGLVLVRNQTKVPSVFNYDLACGPISAEYAKAIGDKAGQFKDRWYMFIGTSDATTIKLEPGDILRVAAEEVIMHETEDPDFPYFTGYVMRVLEPIPEKSRPDPVSPNLERLAALEARRLPPIKKELVDLQLPEFVWIPSFVSIAGSTVYHAEGLTDREPNDIDLILRASTDEKGRYVLVLDPALRLKLDRIMQANFGDKETQYTASPYGPNWDFLAIYDLVLKPRRQAISQIEEPEFKEEFYKSTEELTKQEDPYMELWPEREAHRYMMHAHYRGRGAHIDLRFEGPGKKYLIGWTISAQTPGGIKESVENLDDARKWFKTPDAWKIDFEKGRVKMRQVRGGQIRPAQLYSSRKAKEPLPWMKFEGKVPAGKVGATRYEAGVFLVIDDGPIQLGTQKPYFHEYFLDGDIFKGRLVFRQIGRLEKQDVLPVGVEARDMRDPFFWSMIQPLDQQPYVLSPEAVEKKWMPPDGHSALPEEIRSQIPLQFRYWVEKGDKAGEVRDALVEALKAKTMKLNFDAVLHGKRIEKAAYPYVIQWHYWKKVKVIREGPTTQHWDLRINFGKPPLFHLVFERNPLDVSEASAYEKPSPEPEAMDRGKKGPEFLEPSGDAKPGEKGYNPWNPTKDTPAWVEMLDSGEVEVLERTPGLLRVQFKDGKMKGTWLFSREEPGSPWWHAKRTQEGPG